MSGNKKDTPKQPQKADVAGPSTDGLSLEVTSILKSIKHDLKAEVIKLLPLLNGELQASNRIKENYDNDFNKQVNAVVNYLMISLRGKINGLPLAKSQDITTKCIHEAEKKYKEILALKSRLSNIGNNQKYLGKMPPTLPKLMQRVFSREFIIQLQAKYKTNLLGAVTDEDMLAANVGMFQILPMYGATEDDFISTEQVKKDDVAKKEAKREAKDGTTVVEKKEKNKKKDKKGKGKASTSQAVHPFSQEATALKLDKIQKKVQRIKSKIPSDDTEIIDILINFNKRIAVLHEQDEELDEVSLEYISRLLTEIDAKLESGADLSAVKDEIMQVNHDLDRHDIVRAMNEVIFELNQEVFIDDYKLPAVEIEFNDADDDNLEANFLNIFAKIKEYEEQGYELPETIRSKWSTLKTQFEKQLADKKIAKLQMVAFDKIAELQRIRDTINIHIEINKKRISPQQQKDINLYIDNAADYINLHKKSIMASESDNSIGFTRAVTGIVDTIFKDHVLWGVSRLDVPGYPGTNEGIIAHCVGELLRYRADKQSNILRSPIPSTEDTAKEIEQQQIEDREKELFRQIVTAEIISNISRMEQEGSLKLNVQILKDSINKDSFTVDFERPGQTEDQKKVQIEELAKKIVALMYLGCKGDELFELVDFKKHLVDEQYRTQMIPNFFVGARVPHKKLEIEDHGYYSMLFNELSKVGGVDSSRYSGFGYQKIINLFADPDFRLNKNLATATDSLGSVSELLKLFNNTHGNQQKSLDELQRQVCVSKEDLENLWHVKLIDTDLKNLDMAQALERYRLNILETIQQKELAMLEFVASGQPVSLDQELDLLALRELDKKLRAEIAHKKRTEMEEQEEPLARNVIKHNEVHEWERIKEQFAVERKKLELEAQRKEKQRIDRLVAEIISIVQQANSERDDKSTDLNKVVRSLNLLSNDLPHKISNLF